MRNYRLLISISGIITFSILLVFALLFYRERTLTFDMAYQEFQIILTKSFVTNLRVGALLPQIIPLSCRWLGSSLNTTLLLHSGGFVVLYFSVFALLVFVLKQYHVALAFLLYTVLLTNDTFYWIQSEFPQGLLFVFLYYGWLCKKGLEHFNRNPLTHFTPILFLQFYHPLMVAPLLFAVLYYGYSKVGFNWRKLIKPASAVIIAFVVRVVASRFNEYESARIDFTGNLITHLPNFFTLQSVQIFGAHAFTDYVVYLLLFVAVIALLLTCRRFVFAVLLGGFSISYFILVCCTGFDAEKFYLENMLLPLGVFLVLPLVDFGSKAFEPYRFALPICVIVILTVRLTFIYNAHSPYTARLTWYENKFAEMDARNEQRMLIDARLVPMQTLVMSWPTGYESMLLSALKGPGHTKSVIVSEDINWFTPYLSNDSVVLAMWGVWPLHELPSEYFGFKPGYYQVQK